MDIIAKSSQLGGIFAAGGGDLRPIPSDGLRSIEKMIGADLPEPYRSIVARYGAFTFGGRSQDDPFVFFGSKTPLPDYIAENGHAIFGHFYGDEDADGPVSLHSQIMLFRDRIPTTMIPIAGDGGAGQICIGVTDTDRGKVFYWDANDEPLEEEDYVQGLGQPTPTNTKRHNIYLVAGSFAEFIDQLMLSPGNVS